MYKLEYLKTALDDISQIISYIKDTLCNKTAAISLLKNILKVSDKLTVFPYSYPVYTPIRKLKYEYRKLVIQNYIMFYYINESTKTVTISRVVYARSDYIKKLDTTD